MNIETVDIKTVKLNPSNPRTITGDKFDKLVKSIKEFPEMLKIRPVVVNSDMVVLGGNMRLKALQEAGMKQISIIKADTLTPEQQREFIIKDNIGFGEWDWDLIANDWDDLDLDGWGLEIENFDYSDKNKDIDVDSFTDEMVINLKYSEDDYWKVKDQLSKIAETPEQAVYKLLGNE